MISTAAWANVIAALAYCWTINAIRLHSIQVESKMAAYNRYKQCIDLEKASTRQTQAMQPRLVVVNKRDVVRLTCTPCPSPRTRQPRRLWLYRRWNREDFEDVPVANLAYSNTGFLLAEEFMLLIADVDKAKHGGEYVCADIAGQALSTYYLDVVDGYPVTMITTDDTEFDRDIKTKLLTQENVEMFYIWTPWTGCNRCNLGERRRYATCMLRSLDRKTATARIKDLNLAKLLDLFPGGVPCHSSWIPAAVRNRTKFGIARIVETNFCTIYCATEPPEHDIVEMDSAGNYRIAERVKRGFISRQEDLPPKPPPVVRQVQQVMDGGPLTLYCAHNDGEIFWQKEDIYIPSAVLARYASGRIHYSIDGHLVFSSTIGSDSGFYSCWRYDNVLLQSVRVLVEDPRADVAIKTSIVAGGGVVFLFFAMIIACSFVSAAPKTRK